MCLFFVFQGYSRTTMLNKIRAFGRPPCRVKPRQNSSAVLGLCPVLLQRYGSSQSNDGAFDRGAGDVRRMRGTCEALASAPKRRSGVNFMAFY